MSVHLSSAAANRVQQYLEQTPGTIGLSLSLKKSGCSGWSYVLDLCRQQQADEHVFHSHGIAIFVPVSALQQLNGTEIDFINQGLNQQFIFKNPQVTGECGCGESFSTAISAS